MYKHIKTCVSEFDKFINFIENEKPVLTKKGVLGRKDSFKLNKVLKHKKDVNAPNYNQNQYIYIDFMFDLVLKSKLYKRETDGKRKLRLKKTKGFESFDKLNEYEKYVYLLQTYWSKYDFENKYELDNRSIYFAILEILEAKPKRELKKEDFILSRGYIYSEGALIFRHFAFFEFGKLDLIEGAKKYEDSIYSFTVNILGETIIDFLMSKNKAVGLWNNPFVRKFLDKLPNRDEKAFDVFKDIFPNVNNTVEDFKIDKRGMYYFRVNLSREVYREICLEGYHTLENFHYAILKAFSFNDDHLYAFYINGNTNTGQPIYTGRAREIDSKATTENTTIGDLKLYKGIIITYLYDFGNSWEFSIRLSKIGKQSKRLKNPVVTKSVGEAPAQYNWQ